MTYKLKCPACSHPLYLPATSQDDPLEVLCLNCKYKYHAVYSQVESFGGVSKRLGLLWLNNSTNELKPFEFKPRGLPSTHSGRNDNLILLSWVRGKKKVRSSLSAIVNCSTGRTYQLFALGWRITLNTFVWSFSVWTAFIAFAIFPHPLTPICLFFSSIPAITSSCFVLHELKQHFRERNERVVARLSAEQQLLSQKYELDQKIAQLNHELQANHRLIQRLQDLQCKMISTAPDFYTNRCEVITRGINILEAGLETIQNLIAGYTKIIDILAIEYETSRLAEQIPDDFSEKVLTKLEELKGIEAVSSE